MEIGMYEGRLVGQISRMKNGQKENRELGIREQKDWVEVDWAWRRVGDLCAKIFGCQQKRKVLDILIALSHDRLRVMVEVLAKGWVM